MAYVPLHEGVSVFTGYLNVVHARNPGAAFGILAGLGEGVRSVFFIFISAAVLVIMLWMVASAQEAEPWLLAGYSLFFGGALGNLVDRVRFGEVIDFIDFHVGYWHWPAFNVADSALCVGTACFFIHFLVVKRAP
jgi:signal peptidase II